MDNQYVYETYEAPLVGTGQIGDKYEQPIGAKYAQFADKGSVFKTAQPAVQ